MIDWYSSTLTAMTRSVMLDYLLDWAYRLLVIHLCHKKTLSIDQYFGTKTSISSLIRFRICNNFVRNYQTSITNITWQPLVGALNGWSINRSKALWVEFSCTWTVESKRNQNLFLIYKLYLLFYIYLPKNIKSTVFYYVYVGINYNIAINSQAITHFPNVNEAKLPIPK